MQDFDFNDAHEHKNEKQISFDKDASYNDQLTFIIKNRENINNLQKEEGWVTELITKRINHYLETPEEESLEVTGLVEIPELVAEGNYLNFLKVNNYNIVERLLLTICFMKTMNPDGLKLFLVDDPKHGGLPSAFGGVISSKNGCFYPTLETVAFLLAGIDLSKKVYYTHLLEQHSLFTIDQALTLKSYTEMNRGHLDGLIEIDSGYMNHLYCGSQLRLDKSSNFPAQLLQTEKNWDDLVHYDQTLEALVPLKQYVNGMKKFHEFGGKIKAGHIALFHGLPGTGKTLTASVLGKELGVETYFVNLSQVISKYIGETEKNLDKIFNRLGHTNNILFFDEADALFGKRSEVKEAKDRYANQEVAYLLQRIEKCSCLVILASNFKDNMDTAFTRRILTDVEFFPPEAPLRLQHWERALPDQFKYVPETLPQSLADTYALTGSNISNIIKQACFSLLEQDSREVSLEILKPIITREYIKEGRHPAKPNVWPDHFYNQNKG